MALVFNSPHVLILPFPAQGHVVPLLELSHCLADRGVKVTFVNTEFNHRRMAAAMPGGAAAGGLRMVSFPDGMGPSDCRNDVISLSASCQQTFPPLLEELIGWSREKEDERMTWMIADFGMSWALPVAKKMGLRTATFFTLSVVSLPLRLSLPKLIHDGILDEDGLPVREEVIRLGPDMPPINTTEFLWNHLSGDRESHKAIFRGMLADRTTAIEMSEFILCNTSSEIEAPALAMVPELIAVGPLLAGRRLGKPAGSFWKEDAGCMSWLDEQAAGSVVYVAFGSHTMFDQRQLQELALGLELSGRPFLWVVRPGMAKESGEDLYPVGLIQDRVGERGRIVGWAPQEKVLSHPSTGCFLSHCGWNSAMEGMMAGVPFLCWPYFADQFLNRSYICDVWRVGLRMTPDDDDTGIIISREQIRANVEELLGDKEMRTRALTLKERLNRSVSRGGSSYENLKDFVNTIKECGKPLNFVR